MVVGESRNELLQWINTVLDLNYTKIEQCGTGAVFCQLMDSIVGGVPLNKVKFGAKSEYDCRHNWKILQQQFTKHEITKEINVERLIKCRLQDNLELLQWFKRYWNEHKEINFNYDAATKRKISGTSSPHQTVKSSRNGTFRPVGTPVETQSPTFAKPPATLATRNASSSVNNSNISPVSNGNNYSVGSPNNILSSNYASSEISTRVRPRKTSTATVGSRNSTPMGHRTRKASSEAGEKKLASANGSSTMTCGKLRESADPMNRISPIYQNISFTSNESPSTGDNLSNGHNNNNKNSNNNNNNNYNNNDNSHHHQQQQNSNNHSVVKQIESLEEENESMKLQLSEYRLSCDSLQTERNFYFNKLRDIELFIQSLQTDPEIMSRLDVASLSHEIEKMLYKTEEGFGDHNSNIDLILDNESF
ncbi:uncharacterized protein LODBEIA_P03190 [Lodderomyces beijingensis]|uniref:Uncharacterized protein n=1 Tax=Lodderomyces beijingensis TaxID=1775926 RepID=A0ABP0ZFZ2_9ASCO